MYQHICTGAECPHCSPFSLEYLARMDIQEAIVHATLGHTGVRGVPAPTSTSLPMIPTMDARTGTVQTLLERQLRTFRDGRGEPVTQWPKGPWPRPSTTVIVVHEQYWLEGQPWQVLCQQRTDNGWWGFAGGGQECGESLTECAKREVWEETGYHVRIFGTVCIDSDPATHGCCAYEDGTVQYANTTFLARVQSGVMRTSEESTQVGWFSTDALPQPFLKSHLWRLAQAQAHRGPFLPVR